MFYFPFTSIIWPIGYECVLVQHKYTENGLENYTVDIYSMYIILSIFWNNTITHNFRTILYFCSKSLNTILMWRISWASLWVAGHFPIISNYIVRKEFKQGSGFGNRETFPSTEVHSLIIWNVEVGLFWLGMKRISNCQDRISSLGQDIPPKPVSEFHI